MEPSLPPQCPEQQKRCPDGSCISPDNDCLVSSVNTTPLSTSNTQPPIETVITSSSVVTPSSFQTDFELSASFPSSFHFSTSEYFKQTGSSSSFQTQFKETHIYSEEMQSTRASTFRESTEQEIVSSMFSKLYTGAVEMTSDSVSSTPELISPSVAITTQIKPNVSVSVKSNLLTSSSIEKFFSSYNNANLSSDNVTSSLHTPLSTIIPSSSDNSAVLTGKIITPSLQTPSLNSQSTDTFKIPDITPSKPISKIDPPSITISDISTTPFYTRAPPVDEPFPPWVIATIVCASVVFLFFVILLYVLSSKRRKRSQKLPYKDPDDIGYEENKKFDYRYDQRRIQRPIVEFTLRDLRNSDFRNVTE